MYKGLQLDDEKKFWASLGFANLLQNDKLKNERNMRLALAVGLTAVWILGVIIFYQYRKQKRKEKLQQMLSL